MNLPLRRLPVPARLIARETIGSFLTRLALANALRVPHLLALAAATTSTRSFSPATDDTRGWAGSILAGSPPWRAGLCPTWPPPSPAGHQDARGHSSAARVRALHRSTPTPQNALSAQRVKNSRSTTQAPVGQPGLVAGEGRP